jgi:hypothetical protein
MTGMACIVALVICIAITPRWGAAGQLSARGVSEKGGSIVMARSDMQRTQLNAVFTRSGGIAGLSLSGRVIIADGAGHVQSADGAYDRALSADELALFDPAQLAGAARQLKGVPNDPARDAYVYDFKATLGDGSHVEIPFGERETRSAAGIPGWVARECAAIWRAHAGIAR